MSNSKHWEGLVYKLFSFKIKHFTFNFDHFFEQQNILTKKRPFLSLNVWKGSRLQSKIFKKYVFKNFSFVIYSWGSFLSFYLSKGGGGGLDQKGATYGPQKPVH